MIKMRNLVFFLLVILSMATLSSSQSNLPRNIETVYPYNYSPPPEQSSPAPTPSYGFPVPNPPPAMSPSGTSRKAIMTAVGATAASTLVLAAIFFLLFAWARSRKEERNGGGGGTPALPPAVVRAGSRSEYKRFNGNVRGYIIDEDGLDVLYWKKLSNSGGFRKEPYDLVRNASRTRASVPRGRSSSSQSPIQPHHQSSGGGGDQRAFSAIPKAVPPPPPPPEKKVPEKKVAPPPPPPPPQPKKTPPPPPPPSSRPPVPPPSKKTLESVARAEDDDQVKLKPLHWEKVNVNPDHSMVWDKIDKGSFQYNGDMMEALFGVVATNRRSPRPQTNSSVESSNSAPQIFILDPRRSQNIAIVIKSLGISHETLISSLISGQGLSSETLEKLIRTAPTKEEQSAILAFNDDPSRLADAESFLFRLLKAIPSAFARVDELLFRMNYDSEISNLKESLKTMESACNELRTRGVFMKLLEAILKAGNRLNAGTARGDAKAFNLTTLRKLSDYKSSDGKTTLLHFVVHEVVRNEGRRCVLARSNSVGRNNSNPNANARSEDPTAKDVREKEFLKLGLPVVGGLSSEFSNVKRSAGLDYEAFKDKISYLERSVSEARRAMGDDDGVGCFSDGGREFFEAAEAEITEVREEEARVMGLVKRTTQYYQAGASSDKTPLQLFAIVKDFLSNVDQTCVEIARSLQQKKQGGSASSGDGSGSGSGSGSPKQDVLRSRVTFPRLPEHFLSDKSSSGSDEDS